ncbi:MAG TPA: hypothetical protein VNZ45_10940 [Bacteroidia bacterium]|nr:hypothetical protein [Bacteroidia bacterium]
MLKNALILAFYCIAASALGQNSASLYQKGLAFRTARHYKDALPVFEGLLKQDSSDINYLQNTAFLYAKVWHDEAPDADKAGIYYNKALYLAKKAIKVDSNNAEAHYAYAFAVGVINENASHKQQISNAKLMKIEIDKCLRINPHHAGAYHLLGRWYRRLAELGGIERFAMRTFYGSSLPEATNDDAVGAFQKAILYEPDYPLHQYELAFTYHKMDKNAYAKAWLQQAIKTPYSGDDAADTKVKCQKLLDEIK